MLARNVEDYVILSWGGGVGQRLGAQAISGGEVGADNVSLGRLRIVGFAEPCMNLHVRKYQQSRAVNITTRIGNGDLAYCGQ